MTHGVEPCIQIKNVGENLIVELSLTFLCKGVCLHDLLLVLHQFLCGEALTVDQGLLAVEIGRDLGDLSFGDLEIIAEYPVITQLEDCQSALSLDLLKIVLEDYVAVVADIALVVQVIIIAWKNHLPFLKLPKTLVVYCPVNTVHQSRTCTKGVLVH